MEHSVAVMRHVAKIAMSRVVLHDKYERMHGHGVSVDPALVRPTLAAVVTSYNYAHYLRQALDSLLAQMPPFDEIVVVDDGSTDNSLDVLAEYAGRLRVFTTVNGGHLAACRLAVAQTVSDYIYTMDSDDHAAPGLVARVHAALAGAPAKVQFQLCGVDARGRSLSSVFPVYPAGYDSAAMRQDNSALGFYICPPTSANVFSRGALALLDLSTFEGRSSFDSAPNLAMPYLGEVVSISEPLAFYRVHPDGDSGWCRPSMAQLTRELRLFNLSWSQVVSAPGVPGKPFSRSSPLYVREREMMMACMENRVFVGTPVWRFIAGLSGSHLPGGQKAVLCVWALALLVPSRRLRDRSMRLKRSSLNRSRRLQVVVNVLKNLRGARRSAAPRAGTNALPGVEASPDLLGADV